MDLLIGTGNQGKTREILEALKGLPYSFRLRSDFPNLVEPEETGDTYAENALIKAEYYFRETGLLTLADDSGLEVAALDGRPGVRSARYGGDGKNDRDRLELLLNEIADVEDRRARFVCVIAIVGEGQRELVEGHCDGGLTRAPRGENGFGYDPIFVPKGYEQTFGELSGETKRLLSHRGQALSAARDVLAKLASA